MNKRALMLTAAAIALLSGRTSAVAANCATTTTTYCDITTVITSAVHTSTVNAGAADDIFIESEVANTTTPAGITVSTSNATANTAALIIDSDNNVTNEGTISNKNTPYGVGVEIDAGNATAATVGTTATTFFGTLGTIDLSGTGTNKTGVLLDLPASTIAGGIIDATATSAADIAAGTAPGINLGTVTVVGDNSYGVDLLSGVTLKGPLTFDGAVSVTSSTKTAGASTGITGVEIDGNIVGNLQLFSSILGTGSIVAAGPGARGLVVLGSIDGSIINQGTIETTGFTTTPTTTTSTGNPQGSSAFILANSVTGGIYNAGPIASADVGVINPAAITTQGQGPAFLITPSVGTTVSELDIGLYTADTSDPGYSFYNRGQISAQPSNVDQTALAMHIVGASGTPVVFQGGTIGLTTYTGGILNSGLIGSSVSTDGNGSTSSPPASTALWIDDYVTVPVFNNSSEVGAGHGNITATLGGASSGQAIALLIGGANSAATVPVLYNSGVISASASSSDNTVSFLTAIAISDKTGTLKNIYNTGTIQAVTSSLLTGVMTHTAFNGQNNTSGIDFENAGQVVGDIFFGSGDDTLNVTGTGANSAAGSVFGNISFWGGHDTLNVGDQNVVSGAVLERGGGYVNIQVGTTSGGQGVLNINNTDFAAPSTASSNYDYGTVEAGTLDVKGGATLGLTLSQGFNQAVSPTNPIIVSTNNAGGAGSITLEGGSLLKVSFGSFVSTPGSNPAKFVLFDSQNIIIADPDSIRTSITSTIPFLFSGSVCAYNISGFTNPTPSACTDAPAHDQLVVNLQPKTVGTGTGQIPLTGYAAQIFPYANAALASDNDLGAAIINAGSGILATPTQTVDEIGNKLYQDIYSQFAPDVSGGARQIAISLTDEATSVIGAHQRALRMYAGQNSAATLWGQEFVQRFNNGTDTANGYRDSGFGFALGADGGTPSSGRYGGALTFFSGDILEKVPAQVKTSTEWYMFSGYTDWRGKGMFFDSQVTVGYGSLTGRRSIFVDNSTGGLLMARSATDKRASLMAAGGFSTGAVMNMGTIVFMPQFSMDALTLRENGYTETGGGENGGGDGFDLKVDPYYTQSLRSYVGGTVREDLKIGSVFLQPEARFGYRYDLLADAVKLKAAFAGDPALSIPSGSPFTLTGPDPAKGSLVLGAGLAATTGNWSIGLGYDLLSGGGLTQHTGTFTLVGRI